MTWDVYHAVLRHNDRKPSIRQEVRIDHDSKTALQGLFFGMLPKHEDPANWTLEIRRADTKHIGYGQVLRRYQP